MRRAVLLLFGTVVAATLLPPAGRATGGRYAFAGGTPREQAVVVQALEASSFDWSLVPARVAIHIQRGALSRATPGEIWLDADLLDAGVFAWGVVQHEFAHQVDYLLLTAPVRALVMRRLGTNVWCTDEAEPRDRLGCERFASMLAWAYWPSAKNCMRPANATPAATRGFRRLVSSVMPAGGER